MKLINFALIFVLVFLLALSTPAKTQTTEDVLLPPALNIAICMNDWDKSLDILQKLLGSDTIAAEFRQQLVALRSRLEDYQARKVHIDQSEACAAAITPAGRSENVSNRSSSRSSDYCAANGRCFSNTVAKKRYERSLAEGDYPLPNR